MYEFIFSASPAEEIIGTDVRYRNQIITPQNHYFVLIASRCFALQLVVEVPLPANKPWPPPLEEGVTFEVYNTYINPIETVSSLEYQNPQFLY